MQNSHWERYNAPWSVFLDITHHWQQVLADADMYAIVSVNNCHPNITDIEYTDFANLLLTCIFAKFTKTWKQELVIMLQSR